MRIPSLAILTVFLVCLGHAHAQSFDTFYVVNRYNVLSDEWDPDKRRSGHLPTEVYFPDNQKVSLFAKQQWKKTNRSNPARLRYTQFHCLRVIKPKDSLLIMRIVAGDSIFKVYKKYAITVDTTFFITEVPFNRNVFNVFYPKSGFLKSRKKIIITNDPYQMSYIPPKNKKLRKSYLNRMLKRIQYEYHAATGQLVQLYPSP